MQGNLFISNSDMKKLIIKGLLFLCPLLIIVAVWEYQLNKVVNSYYKKRHVLEAGLSSTEVLVLGNSHDLYGINPAYFSRKGYNLADVSQSLFYDENITLKYLDKMPSLKYVFIDVSYFSLWYQLKNDPIENWRDYFYAQYWNIKYPDLHWYNLNLYSKILIYSPREALQYAMKGFHVDLAQDISNYGWQPLITIGANNNNPQHVDSLTIARIKYLDGFCKADCFNDNIGYLDSLIIQLDKYHVMPILITTPVTPLFLKYADERKISETDSVLTAISRRYNCGYINYLQDTRFVDSDFADADHLNPAGAAKFSKFLNGEIADSSQHSHKKL